MLSVASSCFVTTVPREFGPKWLQTCAGGAGAAYVSPACRLQDGKIRCCLTSCRRRSLGHGGQGSPRVLSVAPAQTQRAWWSGTGRADVSSDRLVFTSWSQTLTQGSGEKRMQKCYWLL